MKKLYALSTLLILFTLQITAQTTEDFETEVIGIQTFSNNGQTFTISSNTIGDTFRVATYPNAGWNGIAPDQHYIDNSESDADEDGTSLVIATSDGTDITIKKLYIFISTKNLNNTIGSALKIEGKKDGNMVYSVSKNSGFANVETLDPNNGYSLIDFSIEGGIDNSNKNVDELVFTITGNGDYVALDAFTWDSAAVTSSNRLPMKRTITLFPNPSTDFIQVSGINNPEVYTILDINGKEQDHGVVKKNNKIDIQTLSKGVYFVQLQNAHPVKFIKK